MHRTLPIFACTFLLTACAPRAQTPLAESLLANPLYVEYYYDDLVGKLVDLEIKNDPVMDDEKTQSLVRDIRRTALKAAQEANRRQRDGAKGSFVPVPEHTTGDALLYDGMLHFDPLFLAVPGPSLHVFLSEIADPRETSFPDTTAIDLGLLQTPYGAQSYIVPLSDPVTLEKIRSVILWDTTLNRLNSFAQLHR